MVRGETLVTLMTGILGYLNNKALRESVYISHN